MTILNFMSQFVMSKFSKFISIVGFVLTSIIAFGVVSPPFFLNTDYLIILVMFGILCVLVDINNTLFADSFLKKIEFYKNFGDVKLDDIIGITGNLLDNEKK